jgi:ABC-type spermidine/putrescine transport system permease subunit II
MKITTKLWIGLGFLILLSPLGLIFPEYFKAGPAWGEWELGPSLWNAPIQDYLFKGWEDKEMGSLSLAYIASAIIGIIVVTCAALLIGRLLSKKK